MASHFFLCACTHTCVCMHGGRSRDCLEGRPPVRWTLSLNLAHIWRPHRETREAEVDCLDPQAKGPAEASAQDSSADLAGKAPRLLGQAAKGCGNYKLPGCGLDEDTWNCGSCEARTSEGLWIWGANTGLGLPGWGKRLTTGQEVGKTGARPVDQWSGNRIPSRLSQASV